MANSAEHTPRNGQTGQWLTATDGQRWWFDSGSVALDFAYTGALTHGTDGEAMHGAAELTDWLNERYTPDAAVAGSTAGPGPRITAQDRDLADALTLRAAIARLATCAADEREADGQDIDIVNLFAATPDIPPALTGGSRQAGRTSPRAGQALSTLARTAVELFGEEMIGRIRYCSAEDCGMLYLDTSRSANRRWCSMQRCGNRAKVRAFRERAHATALPPRSRPRHALDSHPA